MACLTALVREVGRSCKAATVSAIICSPGQDLELYVAAPMHASSWDRLMPHPAHAPLWSVPEMHTRHFSPSDSHFMLMQSSCPTPVRTPQRAMLQGDQLQVSVPSTDISPQTVFGSLDPQSLAALQAAFHDSFAGEGQEFKVHCDCCLTHALYLKDVLDRRTCCNALAGSLIAAGFSFAILCWTSSVLV